MATAFLPVTRGGGVFLRGLGGTDGKGVALNFSPVWSKTLCS